MEVTTAYLREFVRKVFRDSANTAKSPIEILDALSDAALESANAVKATGKMLTTSSDGQGNSATWTMLSKAGGQEEQLKLIDYARTVIGTDTDLNLVLARIVSVRRVGMDFSAYCV